MAVERSANPEDHTLEHLQTLRGVLEFLADRLAASRILVVSDSPKVVAELVSGAAVPIVLATTKDDLVKAYGSDCESVLFLSQPIPQSLDILDEVRNIIVAAYFEGTLGDGEDVLVLVAHEAKPLLALNFSVSADPTFKLLRAGIEDRCDLPVFETFLRIAGDLVRKGREGKAVGTLFVIGDTENVFAMSRQVVINPFHGHPRAERWALDSDNIETIKEYSLLDGAIIVTGDGYLEAAGRYILLEADAELGAGLGGRHLAAASVTQRTRAVAIVVSQTGTVRVYKDGKLILELDGF